MIAAAISLPGGATLLRAFKERMWRILVWAGTTRGLDFYQILKNAVDQEDDDVRVMLKFLVDKNVTTYAILHLPSEDVAQKAPGLSKGWMEWAKAELVFMSSLKQAREREVHLRDLASGKQTEVDDENWIFDGSECVVEGDEAPSRTGRGIGDADSDVEGDDNDVALPGSSSDLSMRWTIREERRKDTELGNVTFREMREAYKRQAIDAGQPQLTGTQLLDYWKTLGSCDDDETDPQMQSAIQASLRVVQPGPAAQQPPTEEGVATDDSRGLPVKAMPPRAPYEMPARASGSERVPGLRDHLQAKMLLGHLSAVEAWCSKNGAAFLSEVIENWEDVLAALPLSESERAQVLTSETEAGVAAPDDEDGATSSRAPGETEPSAPQPDGQKTEVSGSLQCDVKNRSHAEDEARLQAAIEESVEEQVYRDWIEGIQSRTPQRNSVIVKTSSQAWQDDVEDAKRLISQGDVETATKLESMGALHSVDDDAPPPPHLDEQVVAPFYRGEESRRLSPGPPLEGHEGEYLPDDRATEPKGPPPRPPPGPPPGVQKVDAERQSVATPVRNVPDALRKLKSERAVSSQAAESDSWTASGKGSGDMRGEVRKSTSAAQSTWRLYAETGTYEQGRQVRQRVEEDANAPVIAEVPDDPEARRGDWVCPKCGDHQFERNIACRMCWQPKPQFQRRPDGTVVQSGGSQVWMGDFRCPICNTANFARNERCKNCTTPKPAYPEILNHYIVDKGKDKGKSKRADKGKLKGGKPGECLSSDSDRLWAEYKPNVRSRPYDDEVRRESCSQRGWWSEDPTGGWSGWFDGERGASSAKRDSRSEPP